MPLHKQSVVASTEHYEAGERVRSEHRAAIGELPTLLPTPCIFQYNSP